MTRSSALALALAVNGCSVGAFVAPLSRPTASVGVTSGGRSFNALPQHQQQSGHGNAVGPLSMSLFSLGKITHLFGGEFLLPVS